MKFGLGVNVNETTTEVVEKCVEAERLGIDYVWVSDVPVQLYAPAVVAAIAENTRKIRIGLGLISAYLHTPRHIAQSLVTLVETYGERFELCIGPGDRDLLRRVGVSLKHPEGVQHYFKDVKHQIKTMLKEKGIDCRLWLGAQGPKMLEAAANFDGVWLNYAHPDHVKWALETVKMHCKRSLQFGVYAPSYVYSDFDSEIGRLLEINSAVVALGASDAVLRRLNLYDLVKEGKHRLREGATMKSVINCVPSKATELFSISRPSDKLKGYLAQLSATGVQHVVFSYPQNYSLKTVRELALALKRQH
ncbi:MAG TPA: LLM class flavin-dependent oxidoreductase [Candidatus Bathyarchaeia archaeon]|nr:LLM class flavin-dependent oxidoreductase [Candidatus Bathyarchaeia archaeon]